MSLFDEPSRKPLPQPTFEDLQHAGRKGLVAMIPFVGGPGSELLGLLSSPVAQRRDDWLDDLQRRLLDLEGKVDGFKFDDLANNQQFVSATLQATQSALRTHQQEKLEALRNAVVNTALSNGGDDDRRAIFLSLIDRLTPPHLRMLQFFDDSHGSLIHLSFAQVVQEVKTRIPGFQNLGHPVTQALLQDLHQAGLVNVNEHQMVTAPNERWTSDWGHEFIAFITAPPLESK